MNMNAVEKISRYVTGCFAIGISLSLIFHYFAAYQILIVAAYLVVICATDTLNMKIPNLCNICLIMIGFTYNAIELGLPGIWLSLFGLLVGFLLFLGPYALGALGGGDIKALAALGSILGPSPVFQLFIYISLAGGALALFHAIFQKTFWEKLTELPKLVIPSNNALCRRVRSPKPLTRFPYAAAIALGFFFYVNFGEVLPMVANLFNTFG